MATKFARFYPLPHDDISGFSASDASFVILDTAHPLAHRTYSYLFAAPRIEICAHTFSQIPSFIEKAEAHCRKHWLAGYLSYEAAYALEERFAPLFTRNRSSGLPLAWFGVFDRPFVFDHAQGKWDRMPPLAKHKAPCHAWRPPRLVHRIDRETYGKKIGIIRKLIAQGDTYQVNFTYDVSLHSSLPPFELYRQLRQGQPASYCAFIRHSHGHVASFSPELFFAKRGRAIRVKPMKGTARRGRFAAEDRTIARDLARDPKNRAENIMIVDLLRNDLGRICTFGTVRAQRLFDVERHPTLHQMTSTVTGRLRTGVGLADIIRNIFPSGSVTGAPKIRTMEIIRDLEKGPRGVYTGMLGFVSPHGHAEFSVPIRTLQKAAGGKNWQYRVGSGIVWDSRAGSEWEECATKCAFLTRQPPRFEILETVLVAHGRPRYWRDHVRRMKSSARYFGYCFDPSRLEKLLAEMTRKLRTGGPYRVRVLCAVDGSMRWEHFPAAPVRRPSNKLELSAVAIDETNPFLFHKTTHRPWYLAAMKRSRQGRCLDVAFFNTKKQLTECSMSNIFVRRNGMLFTPPVECGLLSGILRARLLKSGRCEERLLYKKDLVAADAIYCGNSVRGLVAAERG